jgi:hypothetical protein
MTDLKDCRVNVEFKAKKAIEVRKENKALKAFKAQLEFLVQEVKLVAMGQQENKVLKAPKALKALKAEMVKRVQMAFKAFLETKGPLVKMVT